ncbi:TonB-dependent receptor [Sphingobium sp. B2]|uniref:TonB-dependent receptor n=1 Tax=Sphingobium sp. B2 TaxID=2583228 RepID=UPI00119C9945|nr:TonB-dependent receptor [Sphingobium sp. B2]
MKIFTFRAVLLATAVSFFTSSAAYAQSEQVAEQSGSGDDVSISDIVVTARRKDERLVDVPVAVSALGSESLARYGTRQLTEIGMQIPQVALNKGGAGPGVNLQIRGVGSQANDAGVEQMVALNVDGVLVSRGRGIINAGMLDVASVEVLKGPQALFFGKNSPGGVISVNGVLPGRDLSGFARIGYNENDHQRFIEGAVTLPVTESLAVRVAGRTDDSRGYIRNMAQTAPDPFHPGFNYTPAAKWSDGAASTLGRVTIAYRPDNDFDATLKVYGSHYTDNGPSSRAELLRCGNGSLTRPTLANGAVDPYGDCVPNFRRSVSALDPRLVAGFPRTGGAPFSNIETYLSSLNMNYNSDTLTITSTTGFFRFLSDYEESFDYTSLARLLGSAKERTTTISQELRAITKLDFPVNFTFGGYYEHLKREYRQDTMLALVPLPIDPATGRYDTADGVYSTRGDTYSIFAQANWKIVENLELAGGTRYTHERRSGTLQNIYVHPNRLPPVVAAPTNLPPGTVLRPRLSNDNVSPEVTLSWHPIRNTTLYAAYKTGFLSAGISNPGNLAGSATVDNVQFRSVKAKGGEIGAKGSLLGGALSIDATAYLYDYDDLQLTSFDAQTFAYVTRNAAGARVKGAELQVNYTASSALSLRGFVAYNHARFRSFPNAQCFAGQTAAQGCVAGVQDLSGQRLGTSPAVSASAGATYIIDLSRDWKSSLSGDLFYSSSYNHSAGGFNFRPNSIQDGFARVNATLKVYSDTFEFAVIGNNLTDKTYIISSADAAGNVPGTTYGFLGRPREILFQATYRF